MPCKQWQVVIALKAGYWREATPDSAIPWWKRARQPYSGWILSRSVGYASSTPRGWKQPLRAVCFHAGGGERGGLIVAQRGGSLWRESSLSNCAAIRRGSCCRSGVKTGKTCPPARTASIPSYGRWMRRATRHWCFCIHWNRPAPAQYACRRVRRFSSCY
jgi:hypothetical protein